LGRFFYAQTLPFHETISGFVVLRTTSNPDNARRCSFRFMLSALRTYRLLSTLLGLSLLFGVAAPLVQTTCAMGQNDRHGAHDCHSENTHSHASAEAPAPPCPHEHEGEATHEGVVPSSLDTRPCCAFKSASSGETVALLSRTSCRDASNLSLAPLPYTGYEAPENVSALPRICAPPPLIDFPLVDRQALLATFLI